MEMATPQSFRHNRGSFHPNHRNTVSYTDAGECGCCGFTPRERDWQKNEVIVDNGGRGYVEDNGKETWKTAQEKGFAYHAGTYRDGENPFTQGTARAVKATKRRMFRGLLINLIYLRAASMLFM